MTSTRSQLIKSAQASVKASTTPKYKDGLYDSKDIQFVENSQGASVRTGLGIMKKHKNTDWDSEFHTGPENRERVVLTSQEVATEQMKAETVSVPNIAGRTPSYSAAVMKMSTGEFPYDRRGNMYSNTLYEKSMTPFN